jgi:hypothetical protein
MRLLVIVPLFALDLAAQQSLRTVITALAVLALSAAAISKKTRELGSS